MNATINRPSQTTCASLDDSAELDVQGRTRCKLTELELTAYGARTKNVDGQPVTGEPHSRMFAVLRAFSDGNAEAWRLSRMDCRRLREQLATAERFWLVCDLETAIVKHFDALPDKAAAAGKLSAELDREGYRYPPGGDIREVGSRVPGGMRLSEVLEILIPLLPMHDAHKAREALRLRFIACEPVDRLKAIEFMLQAPSAKSVEQTD